MIVRFFSTSFLQKQKIRRTIRRKRKQLQNGICVLAWGESNKFFCHAHRILHFMCHNVRTFYPLHFVFNIIIGVLTFYLWLQWCTWLGRSHRRRCASLKCFKCTAIHRVACQAIIHFCLCQLLSWCCALFISHILFVYSVKYTYIYIYRFSQRSFVRILVQILFDASKRGRETEHIFIDVSF